MKRGQRQAYPTDCPVCGAETQVVDSRPNAISIRRRRRCPKCDFRFTTYEFPEASMPTPAAREQVLRVVAALKNLQLQLEKVVKALEPETSETTT